MTAKPDPHVTKAESEFFEAFKELLDEAMPNDGLRKKISDEVRGLLAGKKDATSQQVERTVLQAAAEYVRAQAGDVRDTRERGMVFRPLDQVQPEGAGTVLAKALQGIKNTNEITQGLADQAEMQREIDGFMPQVHSLLAKSKLPKKPSSQR